MITVGCAGFPVPATRYFREFMFVEVQETRACPFRDLERSGAGGAKLQAAFASPCSVRAR